MSNQTEINLPKWPFLVGDAVLLGLGYLIFLHVHTPLGHWEMGLFALIGILGAALAVVPYLLEYRTAVKFVQTGALVSAMPQPENLDQLGTQIATATAQWQGVQEHSAGTIKAAKEISEQMAIETASFMEFMKKADDSERANLRLELEEL